MKKTFEITFTSGNGIYSANLIHAETAEQAKTYFQSVHACEVVGCNETTTQTKPGQPVHEVPDGWTPSELESKNMSEFIKPVGGFHLEKCPFCGCDEVVYEKYEHAAGDRFRVVCIGCMASIDPGYAQDKATVQTMWNRRSK